MLCKVKAKLCKVKTELCKGEEKRKRKNCSGTEQKEKKKMKKAKCTNSKQENPGGKKERGNLSTWERGKRRKNRVIHEVMHIIHKKVDNLCGLHSEKKERAFCIQIIKIYLP